MSTHNICFYGELSSCFGWKNAYLELWFLPIPLLSKAIHNFGKDVFSVT